MLSVKVQYLSGEKAGRELTMPAIAVEFIPQNTKEYQAGLLVRLPPNSGTDAQYFSRTGERMAYIMNHAGKTIGRYEL